MASTAITRWLVVLADPEGPRLPLPRRRLAPEAMRELFDLADAHGVLPAVVDNLTSAAGSLGQLPHDELATARARLLVRSGLAMALRLQLKELSAALLAEGAEAVVLKGTDVADRLYRQPSLRPFTDIDLLIPSSARAAVERILANLSYRPAEADMKYAEGYAEQSWHRSVRSGGVVEVHWNLVNSPSLRRGISVTYEDLQLDRADANSLPKTTSASLLLIAAVHGAASHGFDRLQLLYDVCQIVRGRAGGIDTPWLAQTVARTGASLAMATALDLCRRLTGERACDEVMGALGLKRPSLLSRAILSRGVILRPHAKIDSFRRQWFRHWLKASGRRAAEGATRA